MSSNIVEPGSRIEALLGTALIIAIISLLLPLGGYNSVLAGIFLVGFGLGVFVGIRAESAAQEFRDRMVQQQFQTPERRPSSSSPQGPAAVKRRLFAENEAFSA